MDAQDVKPGVTLLKVAFVPGDTGIVRIPLPPRLFG